MWIGFLLVFMTLCAAALAWKICLRLLLLVMSVAEAIFWAGDKLIIWFENAIGAVFVWTSVTFEYWTSRDIAVGGYWSPLRKLTRDARRKWPRFYA